MIVIANQTTCTDVVMNYVALMCIAELNTVFYMFQDSVLKDELESQEVNFTLTPSKHKAVHERDAKTAFKYMFLWWALQFYEIFYFYIAPYSIFVFIYGKKEFE